MLPQICHRWCCTANIQAAGMAEIAAWKAALRCESCWISRGMLCLLFVTANSSSCLLVCQLRWCCAGHQARAPDQLSDRLVLLHDRCVHVVACSMVVCAHRILPMLMSPYVAVGCTSCWHRYGHYRCTALLACVANWVA
jgi:hypothetical protein